MTPDERQLLEGLFDRVRQNAAAPRDRDAEALIAESVRAQPYAPYLLAQAVIVQEEGLKAAAARIQELEAELAEARRTAEQGAGSFLGGFGKSLFGGEPPRPAQPAAPQRSASGIPSFGARQAAAPMGVPGMPARPAGPWGGQQAAMGGAPAGGSFLRSAMATAAGVAGGALLFSGIQSLMQSHGGDLASSLTDPVTSLSDGSLGDQVGQALGGSPEASPASHAAPDDPMADDGGYDTAAFDDGGDMGDDGGDWA
ncbi:DUF2076 domain-containing protein [Alsobacter sp. R-9]